MEATFEKLKTLQEILKRKYDLEKEINEIPRALATKMEVLNRAKKNFIEKNEAVEDLKSKIRRLQIEMADASKVREDYEKQMDLIKTQKEYEALDKEIKDAGEKEQGLRKEIQKEEKELEEFRTSLEKQERQIGMDEEELQEEEERIKAQSAEKVRELDQLKAEEKGITPGMDEEVLFKFERIIRSKQGLGIVAIKNGVCSGCHMILPIQYVNEVRRREEIKFCPYCSRILDYESNRDPSQQFQEVEAGSLSDLIDED